MLVCVRMWPCVCVCVCLIVCVCVCVCVRVGLGSLYQTGLSAGWHTTSNGAEEGGGRTETPPRQIGPGNQKAELTHALVTMATNGMVPGLGVCVCVCVCVCMCGGRMEQRPEGRSHAERRGSPGGGVIVI